MIEALQSPFFLNVTQIQPPPSGAYFWPGGATSSQSLLGYLPSDSCIRGFTIDEPAEILPVVNYASPRGVNPEIGIVKASGIRPVVNYASPAGC